MLRLPKLLLAALLLFACVPSLAQSNPNEEQGLKPYDSLHGGDLDKVSLTNGGLFIEIPLTSFPQRGDQLHRPEQPGLFLSVRHHAASRRPLPRPTRPARPPSPPPTLTTPSTA